jgi:hypothetical protein
MVAPLTFPLWATSLAQSTTYVQCCDDLNSRRHIRTTGRRPNGPLQQDNVTGDEVREMQRAAVEVYTDSIVSISGVTDGCDCERGSSCMAQVWLAPYRENQPRGLVPARLMALEGSAQCNAGRSNTTRAILVFRASGVGQNSLRGIKERNACSTTFPPARLPRQIGCW